MVPGVKLKRLDNQLGIRPPTGGDTLAIIAPANSGPEVTPTALTRVDDVTTSFEAGLLVEGAAYEIEHYGNSVVLVRAHASVAGSYTSLDTSAYVGTSVPTEDGSTQAWDEYDVKIVFVTGCTIGVTGGTYQWSLDDGRTAMSAVTALGTDNHIILPGSGGVRVNFAAGTIVAGDTLRFRCKPPQWNDTDLAAALDALKLTKLPWDGILILGTITASTVDTIEAKLAAFEANGKESWAIGGWRRPNVGETEAAYATAFNTEFGNSVCKRLSLCAGYAKTSSSVSRRLYKRSPAFSLAPLACSVDISVDLAEVDLGPLPGVALADANGNPDDHDESIYPGLDDMRATTLRHVDGYEGVYPNNVRLLSPTGSDYIYLQFARVMNVGCTETRTYLKARLSKGFDLDPKTGFIADADAQEIEAGANRALRKKLMSKPSASAVNFVLGRKDDILGTNTVTYKTRIIPLGYVKFFDGDAAFFNPAGFPVNA